MTWAVLPGIPPAERRGVAPDRENLGQAEREVLRLLVRNEGLGITRDELADRYLMSTTLQQVIAEINQALRRLTDLGYVVSEPSDGSSGPLFRVCPERRSVVVRLLTGGAPARGATEAHSGPGKPQAAEPSPGRFPEPR